MRDERRKKQYAGWEEGTDCKPGRNWEEKWILKSKEQMIIAKESAQLGQIILLAANK